MCLLYICNSTRIHLQYETIQLCSQDADLLQAFKNVEGQQNTTEKRC